MPLAIPGPTPSYRPVMIFIDGGYLRENLKKEFGDDGILIDGFQRLVYYLVGFVGKYTPNIKGELIRIYYYDAIVDETEKEKRQEQSSFFAMMRNVPFCTVRLGRLVKTRESYRQKGVDIVMAIDMLSKAYAHHYEIAILVAGDGDFVDLVDAVKDAGKRVYGAYLEKHVSEKLFESFDFAITLTRGELKWLISQ